MAAFEELDFADEDQGTVIMDAIASHIRDNNSGIIDEPLPTAWGVLIARLGVSCSDELSSKS